MTVNHSGDQGVNIEGTRITVYTLLPHFLNSATTEAEICQLYELKPEQVAAARAYVLKNVEAVLDRHIQIEERLAVGNPARVIESANATRANLMRFKEWLAQREEAEFAQESSDAPRTNGRTTAETLLTFKEWLAERNSRPSEGS